MERPTCPTCQIPLDRMGVSVGSIGQYDQLDDPSLETWDSFTCSTCGRAYQVNNQRGQVLELPQGGV